MTNAAFFSAHNQQKKRMFIVKSNAGGTDYEPIEAGTYIGRLFMLVDLGTHETEYLGKKRDRRTVRLGWELPTELKDFGKGKLEPHVVGKTYTLSLGSKDKPSALRMDLEAWRGRPFTDEEADQFDIGKLVGVACMLTVSHKAKTSGGIYAALTGIGKPMKGLDCPAAILPALGYQLSDRAEGCFQSLPQWIRDEIQKSKEWLGESAPTDTDVHDSPKTEDDVPF